VWRLMLVVARCGGLLRSVAVALELCCGRSGVRAGVVQGLRAVHELHSCASPTRILDDSTNRCHRTSDVGRKRFLKAWRAQARDASPPGVTAVPTETFLPVIADKCNGEF
jgi:hypothetical protein